MANLNRTEIPLSKTRMVLVLAFSLVATALGIWLLLLQNELQILRIIGVMIVMFFGFTASILVRKLRDDIPGMIIDEVGINDNSSAVAAGMILWRDVKDVFVVETGSQKFIMIEVHEPEKYIERQTHYLQKKAMEHNLKTYGSPLSITAQGLKYNFDKLYTLIRTNMEANLA